MITVVGFVVAAAAGTLLRDGLRNRLPVLGGVPLHTVVPNLAGSFLLGLLGGWTGPMVTVLGTGGLGALTTFSTFADDTVAAGSPGASARVVAVTILPAIALAWAGMELGAA